MERETVELAYLNINTLNKSKRYVYLQHKIPVDLEVRICVPVCECVSILERSFKVIYRCIVCFVYWHFFKCPPQPEEVHACVSVSIHVQCTAAHHVTKMDNVTNTWYQTHTIHT